MIDINPVSDVVTGFLFSGSLTKSQKDINPLFPPYIKGDERGLPVVVIENEFQFP